MTSWLQWIDRPLDWLLRTSVAHSRLVLALCAVITVAAMVFIPSIQLRLDGRSLIPEAHEAMASSDAATKLFEARDVVVLAVEDRQRGIYHPQALEALRKLSSDLGAVGGIDAESVVSLATVPRLTISDGILDLTPLLQAVDRRTGEALPITEETVEALRSEAVALGQDDGILVSADGRAAAVYAEVEAEADRYRLRQDIEALAGAAAMDGLDVRYSGTALAQAVLGEAAGLDLARLVPLVLLVVALLLIFFYRQPAPAVVTLAEVGTSLVWTIGLMGFLGESVFVTTLALPVVLVVIGVSDDVYALNRFFEVARRRGDDPVGDVVVEAFSSVRRPILLTGMTTTAGLLCLILTPLEPQRIFGTYGALAVAFSTLFTFTLVPALLVVLDPPRPQVEERGARWGRQLTNALTAVCHRLRPAGTTAVAVLLVIAAALLALKVEIGDNWVRNLPPESELVQGDTAINELLAGTNTLDLLLDTGAPQGLFDAETFAALGRVEEALLEDSSVGAVEGLYTQLVRVKAALVEREVAEYRAALASGAEEMTSADVEQCMMLLDTLRHSPVASRLDATAQRTRMTVFVRSADYARVAGVLDTARLAGESSGRFVADQHGEVIVPFGDGWVGHTTIRLLVEGQLRSIGVAVVFDVLLLALLFGSLLTAGLAVSPVLAGVLLVLGGIAATSAPLGTANSMFAAIALGIGVDYSIHLVAHHRELITAGVARAEAMAKALASTGPAILTSAVAIAAGFWVLAFSQVLPNRQLGILVASSMALCAVLTLVLVPSLTLLREKT
ncbi:MAG: MMPL family transporter [Acidobacteriota bacterium]